MGYSKTLLVSPEIKSKIVDVGPCELNLVDYGVID